MGHNCLVGEGVPVDNFWYLERGLDFLGRNLFGIFAMELGNSEGDVGIVEVGLDTLEGVLDSSTLHWHTWERHFGSEGVEFGKVEDDFGKWEVDLDILEVDFGRLA